MRLLFIEKVAHKYAGVKHNQSVNKHVKMIHINENSIRLET